MKICLVNPPLEDFYTTGIRRQPLGLLYIGSALRSDGHDIQLINCHTRKRSTMELPAEFSYLEKYMSSGENRFPFADYTHYGMSWQEIEKRIKESHAGLYLVSSMFTTYHEEAARVIRMIRKHSGQAVIAAGGHHASLYPWHLLKAGADFIIRGEGETPSALLAKCIEHGGNPCDTPNLLWFEHDRTVSSGKTFTPDIDELPVPERNMLSSSSMKAYGKTFISMITSRGCPNRCAFCTSRTVWGNSHRQRSIKSIIEEIKFCHEKLGAGIINFEDDNIFPTRERAVELLASLAHARETSVSWPEFTAMNGVSIEKLDTDIPGMLKRAGFRELNISLVTYSAVSQEKTRRPFDSGQFMKIAQAAVSAGLNVRGYFILGLPGQSVKEAEETTEFMKKLGITIFPSVYYNVNSPESEWKTQRSSAFFNEREDFGRDDLIKSFNSCFR